MRRIRFASFEHQQREIHARHFHASEGPVTIWGNGETVMRVTKGRKPFVEIIGEDGLNAFGDLFRYADYFLPEELARTLNELDGEELADVLGYDLHPEGNE